MRILDGRLVSQKIRSDLKEKILLFCSKNKKPPGLALICVGNNPASQVYVRQKVRAAKQVGIYSEVFSLPETVSLEALKQQIQNLNRNQSIHAVLVQLPLPPALSWREVISWVEPRKDVDCLTVENQGLAWSGPMGNLQKEIETGEKQRSQEGLKSAPASRAVHFHPRVLPCTPSGIMKLFEYYKIALEGKSAVVVGRSQIVGLPMAQLLLRANMTVTVCHSHTVDLSYFTRSADIVVSAVGCPGLLGEQHFKKGAVAVDVGIHRIIEQGKSKLKGDIRFEELENKVAFATPVPGGVGPMTVTMLLENTFQLACQQQRMIENHIETEHYSTEYTIETTQSPSKGKK